jgi:hypothetical protein
MDEDNVLLAAAEYLAKDIKENGGGFSKYMEYAMGADDAVRKLAEDIGYLKSNDTAVYEDFNGEQINLQHEEENGDSCLQCLFCSFLGIYKGCLQFGTIPENIFNKEAQCPGFMINDKLKKTYEKYMY